MPQPTNWPTLIKGDAANRVQYRTCSQKAAWRVVNNHQSAWGALFSADGAKALFTPGARLYNAKKATQGEPHFVVIWEAGDDWALMTNGTQVALVDVEVIMELDALHDAEMTGPGEIRQRLQALFQNAPKRGLSEYEAALSQT